MSTAFLLSVVLASPQPQIETRSLLTGPQGAADTSYMLTERVFSGDSFSLQTKTVTPGQEVSYYISRYAMDGSPISMRQEGRWNDRWNIFETTYGPKKAVQSINGVKTESATSRETYRDPTLLWFWHTHPKVGQTETVTFLAQNTIVTYKIKFTYEGDEKVTLADRKVTLHRVREDPENDSGVYTLWWYDDAGMGVKRYHKTTQHEYWYNLLSWR